MYLLDANIIIEANKKYYGMDFCPAFWDWLIKSNHAGKVFSTQEIAQELKTKDDAISQWAKGPGKVLFLQSDAETQNALRNINEWVSGSSYHQSAKDAFLDVADPELIAYAKAHRGIIVTEEKPAPDAKKSIKIPDVCKQFNVECIDTFQMLKREKARFILDPN